MLHVQTKGLNSNGPPDKIPKTIADFALELKSKKSDVSISSVTMRADKPETN